MKDQLVAVVRTIVPAGWGSLLAFLVDKQLLPAEAALDAAPLGVQLAELVVVPVTIGAYYVVVRWLEKQSWMPRWLVRFMLGSAKQPTYSASSPWTPR